MTELYQTQYLIGSNMSGNIQKISGNMFFATISVRDKQPLLGTLNEGDFCLSVAGMIAQQVWQELPLQFNHIRLGTFSVRPQHIQGVISVSGNHVSDPEQTLQVIIKAFQAASAWEIKKHSQVPFKWQARHQLKPISNLVELKEIERYISHQKTKIGESENVFN